MLSLGSDQVNLFLLLGKLWVIGYILLLEYPCCSQNNTFKKNAMGYSGPTPKQPPEVPRHWAIQAAEEGVSINRLVSTRLSR